GRSNVGKSTFLNSALGMPLAIVSRLPQTTRDALLGVVNSGDAQLAFVDTPGLHHPKNELGRRMNHEATESLRNAGVALFMTDVHELGAPEAGPLQPQLSSVPPNKESAAARGRAHGADRTDADLVALLPEGLPTVLVVNKVDRVRDKTR